MKSPIQADAVWRVGGRTSITFVKVRSDYSDKSQTVWEVTLTENPSEFFSVKGPDTEIVTNSEPVTYRALVAISRSGAGWLMKETGKL